MSFEPGTVIAGKYRVERVIGQGGMGVVLAARHLGLDEMVAVKLIREERGAGADALARFQREARAAARIKSEHIARVFDVDRLPEGDPYIVMELIDGTDLDALLKRRGPLPPEEAAAYVLQACEGLAEAHSLGMVHRDLKLKNLFLTKRRDGRPLIKVIDFGVVKLGRAPDDGDATLRIGLAGPDTTLPHDATLTGASMLVGSVHYMAPEQIRASKEVDARADVWSLGVCLYVLLTGALPFEGETLINLCAAIQGRHPRDVRDRVPSVPAALARVVAQALEKDLRRRFGDVAELAAALEPFASEPGAAERIERILGSAGAEEGRAARSTPPGSNAPAAPAAFGRIESTIDGAVAVPTTTTPARRGRFVTGTLLLVAAAGGTYFAVERSNRLAVPESPSAAASPAASPSVVAPTPASAAPSPAALSAVPVTALATSAHAPSPMPSAARPPTKRAPVRPTKSAPPAATAATTSDPASAYDQF